MLRGVKGRLGSLFRIFTILLLIVCAWTAYANVFSDDTDVRAKAGELARKEAGCGDKCKQTSMRGNRGMIEESIEYEMDKVGTIRRHVPARVRRRRRLRLRSAQALSSLAAVWETSRSARRGTLLGGATWQRRRRCRAKRSVSTRVPSSMGSTA